MSKCTTKQNDNIGTAPICQKGKFRRKRDQLKPSGKTKCIDKWQKPMKINECLPLCKQNRHKKHKHKHLP